MYAIYLLINFAVTVLTTFSISMSMVSIPGTTAMCRAPTPSTRVTATTTACSDDTDGTRGTCNGSSTPYVPSLSSSAIRIPTFDWDMGNRYSEWLKFIKELYSIFYTPTYTSLTAKDHISLIVHWMGPEFKLYYSLQEPACNTMELDRKHFLDHVTDVWTPVRATVLQRVKFTNMNRSQNQTGDDYMSLLKYTVLGCNFIYSEERIRDQLIKGIIN